MRLKLVATALLGIFLSKTCLALENATQVGRYITIANIPKLGQSELLSQIIEVRFPQNIQTVGSAMNYLLRFSGYSLTADSHMNPELKNILKKPLPIIDRNFGPLSLKIALGTLAGPAFKLIDDPVNREINFNLNSEYLSQFKNIKQRSHH